MHRSLTALVAGLAAVCLAGGAAHAQTWPSKRITVVVPSAPGGLSDPVVRLLGEAMQRSWGQAVVMEHRAGAGGIVGTQYVIQAPPDGHTLLMGNIGPLAVTPALNPNVPYNVQRDLAPVSLVVTFGNVLVVNPTLPLNSVRDVIQAAKARPGSLNFASSGNGQSHHLSGELFKSMTGIDIVHVPYKGSGPALTDVISGQVQMMFSNIPAALQFIKTGQLRALAVTAPTRSAALPEVPTVAESGVPGYAVTSWLALYAPAKTPRAVIDRVNAEITRAWATPEGQKLLSTINADAGQGTPDQVDAFVQGESAKWARLIREANIKGE